LSSKSLRGRSSSSASDAEQRYLAAIADLGDGPVRSPRRGMIDFTVPLFANYLRREHPLESFADGG
jgi:hypothetical protein